ncbi:hypothetical protein HHK36_029956 [Tetracentron sinense]|uniref:Transmembrane protein 214 n=1 Tax=Tetracentron sinense TaxID=13715 RepID=A0A834YAF5_TETSI|nr:hypothetical protein HHK36_029956 [Tetracentron sinense]
MEENSTHLESNLNEKDKSSNTNSNNDHGWQKVTYIKRQRKPSSKPSDFVTDSDRFRSLEQQSKERRSRALEAQKSAAAAASATEIVNRSKHQSDDDEDDSDSEISVRVKNEIAEAKKPKEKKPKKPKISVADAASKIDASDLAAFLIDVSASYDESQQDIQLMRFADYFGHAFSSVSASQFPWTKMFKESTVAKMADIPLLHISEAVYKTSVDWINQRSSEALGSFVLWLLDSILVDLANQQGVVKGSKKVIQQASPKAQVAIFVVLAMLLRRKPDVLISLLPISREDPKYLGQDKLPIIVWMITQASHGDLVVGMYLWVHNLLPIISGKSSCNPQSRDLVLQLAERILSSPKARPILLNGAVRKGERLVPPSALELLMQATFSASSARVKATERFEAIYPTLREVALTGSPGSKAMKQVSQQILSFVVKEAGESIPELSEEATGIFIWCLSQNPDCYKQWDKIYLDNLEASVAVLRKLSDEWKEHSVKHSSLEPMRETLKGFRQTNEKALASGEDAARQASFKDADKYCKVILGRLSHGNGCMKSVVFAFIALALGAVIVSQNMESWDWNKLSNEKALASGEDAAQQPSFKDADKYCKVFLGRLSRGNGCMKSLVFAFIALTVGAVVVPPNMESWDWNKLSVMFFTVPGVG